MLQTAPPPRTLKRHVTQALAASVLGVSESTLGRWCCELAEGELPYRGEHWDLTSVVKSSLYAALGTCPDAALTADRDALAKTFSLLWRELAGCWCDALSLQLHCARGGYIGLSTPGGRSVTITGNGSARAISWTCDAGTVIESAISAYRTMLREHGLTDGDLELEPAPSERWRIEGDKLTVANGPTLKRISK